MTPRTPSPRPAPPAAPPTRRDRTVAAVRTGARRYRTGARIARATGRQITTVIPGTDRLGALMTSLSLAGLVGLLIYHPTVIAGTLARGIGVMRTVIGGGGTP